MRLTLLATDIFNASPDKATFPPSPGSTVIPEEERGHAYPYSLGEIAALLDDTIPKTWYATIPRADARLKVPDRLTVRDVVLLPDGCHAITATWAHEFLDPSSSYEGNDAVMQIEITSPREILAWWHDRHAERVESERVAAAVVRDGLDDKSIKRKRDEALAPLQLDRQGIDSRTATFRRGLEAEAAAALVAAGLNDEGVQAKISRL